MEYTRKQLQDKEFHKKYKKSKRHFIRKSALGFTKTAMVVLNMIKKSIKVEIMDFFFKTEKTERVPSRQALTEAREKISYLAFKDFFDKSCELALDEEGMRLYKGYRLFGVDGTSFVVGLLSKLKEYFGESTTIAEKAMCRISAVVDVLNDCIVNASVSPFSTGERALAIEQITQLKAVSNALYLFDRGYWSPELVGHIIRNGQKFLMRLASNVGKTVVTDDNGNICPLRRYSFILPSGEIEVLLTNLSEDEVSDDELAALYAKRWGAETKYLQLKDRLQIDCFSGNSVNIVLQDIYSTLYISNVVAFTCSEADEIIKAKTAGKNNKYQQKSNRTTCISTFRTRFIFICLLADEVSVDKELQNLFDVIAQDVVYINKSKSRPRDKRKIKQARSHKHKSIL
jgi:hypothetical protein